MEPSHQTVGAQRRPTCSAGHACAAMTLDTYADLFDDDLDAVAERLHPAAEAASGATADQARTDGQLITPLPAFRDAAGQQIRAL